MLVPIPLIVSRVHYGMPPIETILFVSEIGEMVLIVLETTEEQKIPERSSYGVLKCFE